MTRPRCLAFGVRPDSPKVMWDKDIGTELTGSDAYMKALESIAQYIKRTCVGLPWGVKDTKYGSYVETDLTERPWSVYETKHGFHLVIKCKTWDEAQYRIFDIQREIGGQSIMSCRMQRLRVSPKIAEVGGQEISPAPILLESNVTYDIRARVDGRPPEVYKTYDIGLDSLMTKEQLESTPQSLPRRLEDI